MSSAKTTVRLVRAIDRFIVHKRALGSRYRQEAWLLQSLRHHVEDCGRQDLDAHSFDHWLRSLQNRHPNTQRKWYQIVRYFCLYRRRSEPRCFLPPAEGAPKRQPHITPMILEPEQIAGMLATASKLAPTGASPLRPWALRLAIVLLYACGLRLGELLRLTIGDVEEQGTVLRIRESKFHKSRLVPLSPSATDELQTYLRRRRKTFSVEPSAPLLGNRYGGKLHHYSHAGMQGAINHLFDTSRVRDERGKRPRVHDLRHSFAVQALIRWYRNGADVQTQLPKLALYMGHVSIESSAYYLHWIPSLRSLASQRFEKKFGRLVAGGGR